MPATLLSALERVVHDTADTECGVDADLSGHFMGSAAADRAAGPGIRTLRTLADHHEIDVGVAGQRAAYARVPPTRAALRRWRGIAWPPGRNRSFRHPAAPRRES